MAAGDKGITIPTWLAGCVVAAALTCAGTAIAAAVTVRDGSIRLEERVTAVERNGLSKDERDRITRLEAKVDSLGETMREVRDDLRRLARPAVPR